MSDTIKLMVDVEVDNRSVRQKLNDGHYKNKLEYPRDPKAPAVFRKSASELTDDEIANLKTVRKEYDDAVVAARQARIDYNREDNRLIELLQRDLEVEHGLTNNPKRGKLWSKAWDHGHSSGLSEVVCWYEDLAELIE